MAVAETIHIRGYICGGCDHVSRDAPESPLYECPNCGTVFTRESSADGLGHRCPDCNKFSSRIADYGCPDCESAEMKETDVWECSECDELFIYEDEAEDHVRDEHPEDEDDNEESEELE